MNVIISGEMEIVYFFDNLGSDVHTLDTSVVKLLIKCSKVFRMCSTSFSINSHHLSSGFLSPLLTKIMVDRAPIVP